MSMCMNLKSFYVCLYVEMCVIRERGFVCVFVYAFVCDCICIYVYLCIRVCVYAYLFMGVCLCFYLYMYMSIFVWLLLCV